MPQNLPYMPQKDAVLGTWADNFSALITAAPATYGLVAGDAVAIAAVVDPFITALATATNPATRTPVAVAAKDSAREAMKTVVMPFAVEISQNAAVTEGNKTGVGVTVRSEVRTRNSVVAITCDGTSVISGNSTITFRATDPANPTSKSRPLGALGWELMIQYSNDVPAAVWTTHVNLVATKPIYIYDFTGFPAHLYTRYRVRWVGASLNGGANNHGPWSPWQDPHIP